jgi:hypothetical protein
MIENQLSIFLENKPGVLAAVCKTLGDHGINIRGLCVSDTVDHAVVRMIVSDPQKAIHILGEHGALVVETDVLAVELSDSPGELAKLSNRFSKAKINVEYAYGSSDLGQGVLFIRVSDVKKAAQLLSAQRKSKKK